MRSRPESTFSGLDHWGQNSGVTAVSRVFVSSAYRDRAVGDRVGGMLHSLGDEPVDDRDDTKGTAWWNEVVGRIETCELFVAVVSPAYAEAHACRLAARHAAATGLPVVRLDLDDKPPESGLHPIVTMATPVRFDPDDPDAPEVLERALDAALLADQPPEPTSAEPDDAPPPWSPPPAVEAEDESRFTGLELLVAVALCLVAAALLVIEARSVGHIVDRLRGGSEDSAQVRGISSGADRVVGQPTSSASPHPAGDSTATPEARQLLSMLTAIGSDRLSTASCVAGDGRVTCRDPAPNIQVAVFTTYPTPGELYAAYTAAVRELSGDPVPENTGDCSGQAYEGEITWNLDLGHDDDVSVEDEAAGGLDPATEAAGRLFCTETSDVVNLVWTQDPALLVTATGQPARLTVGWWHGLHLDLACATGGTGTGCP
jgi:hypothetical protein